MLYCIAFLKKMQCNTTQQQNAVATLQQAKKPLSSRASSFLKGLLLYRVLYCYNKEPMQHTSSIGKRLLDKIRLHML
jgi:hypothetical protein